MISAPPQSVAWFARHELLLAWRDWLSMMTAGKRTRERVMLVFVALFVVGLHWLGVEVLRPALVEGKGLVSSKAALVLVAAMTRAAKGGAVRRIVSHSENTAAPSRRARLKGSPCAAFTGNHSQLSASGRLASRASSVSRLVRDREFAERMAATWMPIRKLAPTTAATIWATRRVRLAPIAAKSAIITHTAKAVATMASAIMTA
jgi:hypothetical protein